MFLECLNQKTPSQSSVYVFYFLPRLNNWHDVSHHNYQPPTICLWLLTICFYVLTDSDCCIICRFGLLHIKYQLCKHQHYRSTNANLSFYQKLFKAWALTRTNNQTTKINGLNFLEDFKSSRCDKTSFLGNLTISSSSSQPIYRGLPVATPAVVLTENLIFSLIKLN